MTSVDDCYSCVGNASVDDLPARDRIMLGSGWRAAHAGGTSLPGWLVVVTRRHVTSMAELTSDEATELGLLTWRLSRALVAATGCAKTYVAAFSEAEGFTHLHVHVIPRAADLPAEDRGPAIFRHLRGPASSWVPTNVQDDLAAALITTLASMP